MKKEMKNLAIGASMAAALVLGSCSGGGTSTFGTYQSPSITVAHFLDSLNYVDGANPLNESELELDINQTIRSAIPGEDDYFVIWDALYGEYKAFSLQYLRSIVYYDFYRNNFDATAQEFRDIEVDDILNGDVNGEATGTDYEVVTEEFDAFGNFLWFEGVNSFEIYEDETETKDVALMAGRAQSEDFIRRSAKLSMSMKLPFDTAKALVSLGDTANEMLKKGSSKGELTQADQDALTKGMLEFTGTSMTEILEASVDEDKKEVVLDKIADKIGVSSQRIEAELLPMFNIK
jgi:hypothetical protein